MASEIRVNQIQNRSGLGTVTFSDTGVSVSGILTATTFSGNLTGNVTGTVSSSGIATFSNGIIVAAGTTAAPSISPTGDSNTGIFFPSPDTVAIGEGGVEVARFNSSGNFGLGTNNPSTKLEIVGAHSSGSITTSFKISGSGWSLGGGPSLEFGHDPASYPTWVTGRIASTYSGSSWGGGLKFFYNNGTTAATLTEGMELTRDGNLAFPSGKGIDFSATANSSGTMTSELLDDYERGTWTATVVSGGSAITTNYASYIKVGNLVFVTGRVGGLTSPNGAALYISGLPFTVKNNIESIGPAMLYNVTFPSSMTSPVSYFNYNTANVYLYYSGSGTTWTSSTGTQFGTGGIWIISGCYEAA